MALLRKKDILTWLLLGAMALYLIFDSKNALLAGQRGVELCLKTVIPSLFPFFVLSRLLTAAPVTAALSGKLSPMMEGLFHLPGQAAGALLLGALGGYPTGAKTTAEMVRSGALTRDEGERLLTFCSNAGPGFIFGMLGAKFGLPGAALLLVVHLGCALTVGLLLRGKEKPVPRRIQASAQAVTLPQAVKSAIAAMGAVCAYVVLFSIVSQALAALSRGLLPGWTILILTGILELTAGCAALPGSWMGMALAGLFLSFGGLCVLSQVKSVIAPAGLTGKYYLRGKALQAALSAGILFLLGRAFPGILLLEAAAVPGNHQGLLAATAWVALAFSLIFLVFAAFARKRAGKSRAELL